MKNEQEIKKIEKSKPNSSSKSSSSEETDERPEVTSKIITNVGGPSSLEKVRTFEVA